MDNLFKVGPKNNKCQTKQIQKVETFDTGDDVQGTFISNDDESDGVDLEGVTPTFPDLAENRRH